MVKIYGFVAEFNPFHNGHKLFIDEIKKKYHPDVLIAIVSGNFVQRGDFAIVDKWSRTDAAIKGGVDLVVELPFAYSVEPANLFAKGSIRLLKEIGINNLVFGTETNLDFTTTAEKLLHVNTGFDQRYQDSYAKNLNQVYVDAGVDVLNHPNQLLGLNYVQEILTNDYKIDVNTILRKSGGVSATKIRHNISDGKSINNFITNIMQSHLNRSQNTFWDDYFELFKYRIQSSSVTELHDIYQMVEGLEYKFIKEINKSNNFSGFLDAVKSKRYTRARLRRLSMYTLMNVKTSEVNSVFDNPYLRVLGFDTLGKQYLNTLKKDAKVPIITRVGKKESDFLSLELKVDRIRKLVDDREQDFGRIPIMEGENQC
ncbi:nucleotidyltransferase family protein [Companilactobacillus jidongensis]|uniref:nucleotidyltransferase family protein n=1 Tax=Companilactobacillus jidongensis TaxID=2486006 RepID=UPI000F7A5180|nr:nucleotidyltransferase family protein [Companilactobacillus jidongensis]